MKKVFILLAVMLTFSVLSACKLSARKKCEPRSISVGILQDIEIVPTSFNECQKSIVRTDYGTFVVRGLASGIRGSVVNLVTDDNCCKRLQIINGKTFMIFGL